MSNRFWVSCFAVSLSIGCASSRPHDGAAAPVGASSASLQRADCMMGGGMMGGAGMMGGGMMGGGMMGGAGMMGGCMMGGGMMGKGHGSAGSATSGEGCPKTAHAMPSDTPTPGTSVKP